MEVPSLESSANDAAAPALEAEAASSQSPAEAPSENGFEALGLMPELIRAVADSGYTTPTPIQAQGIPKVLMGRDIIGIAQTGTGKTASFTLPMIEILSRGRAKARMPRSLILAPTRELAAQVSESFERYGKFAKLSMALLIGGVSFDDQERKLDRGVDVLIATPGRLLDHFERGKLMLTGVQILVIDEADRMLDMGFIPDVEKICKLLPFTRQTLFYSATMPPEITRLTEQFLHNPVRVEVARPATTAENITQEIIEVAANDWAKRETLRRLVRDNPVKNAIVFCNRKRDVDVVAKSLQKHGFSAAPLHGDLEQSQRMKTLDAFKNNEIQLLVASDVAARGLDIPAVSHIFNFDVPFHADDYVHRIGRTGRAGRSGHAFMMASPRDFKAVDAIEKLIKKTLPRRTIEGVEPRADLSERSRERRNSGRDRGHERKAERSRPVKDHGQRASMEPLAPAAEEVAAQARPAPHAKPEFRSKPEHRERARDRAPERGPDRSNERGNDRARPAQPREKHLEHATEDAVQLPAFLLRPVKLPKAKDEAEVEVTAESPDAPKAVKASKVAKPRTRKKKTEAAPVTTESVEA
ncbi:MAG: DEAD/DEAH box helicase [Pseudomonadota bacterium]|nr:DEAD/DEAH box helicase [Pseudomonadota bacterium]